MSSLKTDEFKLRQLRRRKVINDLEYDTLGPNYEFLLFEDLQFQSMAKSKMFEKNQFDKGVDVWNNKLKSRELRQIVLEDDVKDLKQVEENFNERDDRIEAGDMRPRRELRNEDSVDSDGMSSFDSRASRVNFWKDINIKDEALDENNTIVLNHKKAIGDHDPLLHNQALQHHG